LTPLAVIPFDAQLLWQRCQQRPYAGRDGCQEPRRGHAQRDRPYPDRSREIKAKKKAGINGLLGKLKISLKKKK
jgi:hypothetical protein